MMLQETLQLPKVQLGLLLFFGTTSSFFSYT